MFGHPGYVFNRRTYKTLSGLMTALMKDAGLFECGFPSATLAVCCNREGTQRVEYDMTAPKAGEQQHVTRRKA